MHVCLCKCVCVCVCVSVYVWVCVCVLELSNYQSFPPPATATRANTLSVMKQTKITFCVRLLATQSSDVVVAEQAENFCIYTARFIRPALPAYNEFSFFLFTSTRSFVSLF